VKFDKGQQSFPTVKKKRCASFESKGAGRLGRKEEKTQRSKRVRSLPERQIELDWKESPRTPSCPIRPSKKTKSHRRRNGSHGLKGKENEQGGGPEGLEQPPALRTKIRKRQKKSEEGGGLGNYVRTYLGSFDQLEDNSVTEIATPRESRA